MADEMDEFHEPVASSSGGKKRSHKAQPGGSSSSLPLQRVRNMMRMNDRVAMVTTEAAVLMTRAAEQFIGWLTTKAMDGKPDGGRARKSFDYADLPPLLEEHPDRLEFLTDLLPQKKPKWEHLNLPPPPASKKPSKPRVAVAPVKPRAVAKPPPPPQRTSMHAVGSMGGSMGGAMGGALGGGASGHPIPTFQATGFGMPIPTGESLPGALPTHLGKRSWIGEILQAQAAQHAVQAAQMAAAVHASGTGG
ncbi:hypothetical protein T484DRAFT_1910015, partial [Baffinella frigidus]